MDEHLLNNFNSLKSAIGLADSLAMAPTEENMVEAFHKLFNFSQKYSLSTEQAKKALGVFWKRLYETVTDDELAVLKGAMEGIATGLSGDLN